MPHFLKICVQNSSLAIINFITRENNATDLSPTQRYKAQIYDTSETIFLQNVAVPAHICTCARLKMKSQIARISENSLRHYT